MADDESLSSLAVLRLVESSDHATLHLPSGLTIKMGVIETTPVKNAQVILAKKGDEEIILYWNSVFHHTMCPVTTTQPKKGKLTSPLTLTSFVSKKPRGLPDASVLEAIKAFQETGEGARITFLGSAGAHISFTKKGEGGISMTTCDSSPIPDTVFGKGRYGGSFAGLYPASRVVSITLSDSAKHFLNETFEALAFILPKMEGFTE